ncbi:MAG: NADP oxidoreductase [Bryobacteraceae bacterium]|nr:NADP oxidoreductase [Bryobacteraceae bacterium]
MSKLKLATVWLDGCSGCHMSLLDIDDAIVEVAALADLVYGPLVDAQEFPEGVDVTLVEGAVSSQDDLKLIQTIRKRTRLLVALGDCAVTGNVPAMRNSVPVKKLLESVYSGNGQPGAQVPTENVPALLKKAAPVHEAIKVDLHIPGCPPAAQTILLAVRELLAGRKPNLATVAKFG